MIIAIIMIATVMVSKHNTHLNIINHKLSEHMI